MFPVLLRNMITSCCQACSSHTTNVDFRVGNNPKHSIEDMRRDIGENDLSFPVYGNSDQEKYGSFFGFASVILSPGDAYVVNREPKKSSTDFLLTLVLSCWPIIILNLVFSLLAGIVIWLLVSQTFSKVVFFLFIYWSRENALLVIATISQIEQCCKLFSYLEECSLFRSGPVPLPGQAEGSLQMVNVLDIKFSQGMRNVRSVQVRWEIASSCEIPR